MNAPGQRTRPQTKTTSTDGERFEPIRGYVRAYEWRHGRRRTSEAFGVSRHTLGRFSERGHVGRYLPGAVLSAVGSAKAFEAAFRLCSQASGTGEAVPRR